MTEASNVEGQDIATAPEEIKGDKVDLIYENHGGNPSNLDLTRCLIVSSLPSSFLNDSYDIFRDCIVDLLAETFKIQPDVIDAIIRIPSLQKDAATQENALRAIVSFKNRVHKHRVFAQKKHAEESTFHVDGIEKIPEEFLKIKEESAEEEREEAATEHEYLADEEEEEEPVVEEDHVHEDELLQEDEEEHSGDDEDAGFEMADEVGEDELGEEEEEHEKEEEPKEQVDQEEDSKKESVKTEEAEKKKKKVYIDEDDNAPFVVSWEGAPEFQWRVPSDYADTRRLIIENVQWGDLRDVFIYRAMIKAENVDIQFPMRYNLDGTRPFYGKLTLLYDFNGQLLGEVIKHLIYFRSTDSHRRIKIFLPQVPKAVKRKEELELKLGHLIKPTPRMFQLIVKVLPAGYEPTLDDACAWFPSQSVTDVQLENDELNQPCAIVTFETVEEAVAAHASKSIVVVSTEPEANGTEESAKPKKEKRCSVFMRGVEAHFGSLVTRFDRKQSEGPSSRHIGSAAKRPASTIASARPPKRGRGLLTPSRGRPSARSGTPPASYRDGIRGSSRGGYPPRGRGAFRATRRPGPARGARGGYHGDSLPRRREYPAPGYDSRDTRDIQYSRERRPVYSSERPSTYLSSSTYSTPRGYDGFSSTPSNRHDYALQPRQSYGSSSAGLDRRRF